MEPHAFSRIDPKRFRDRFSYNLDNPGYKGRPVVGIQHQFISETKTPEQPFRSNRQINSGFIASNQPTQASLRTSKRTIPELGSSPRSESIDHIGQHVVAKNIDLQLTKSNKLKLFYRNKLQLGLSVVAIAIVITGGYMSFVGFRANHIAVAQADRLTKEANASIGVSSKPPKNVLSTVKPTAKAVASYVVAPNLPKYLIIPRLGVDARVLSVGVNASGALETPDNVYDTAWYNESAEPGQPGAVLIDGHISSWTAHGVFYRLKDLVSGDIIKVERGDGTVFTYKVVKTVVYPANNVSMTAAITPVVTGVPGLNLISCDGDVIPGTNKFNERIVVFSEQVGP